MKLYLDTGDLSEIESVAQTGLLDGVTTNPSLIKKTKKPFEEQLVAITTILTENHCKDFTVSAEVTADDCDGMVKQGLLLAKLSPHIIIKVPLTKEGLLAVREFAKKNIRTNVTLCFNVSQALLAAKAGAFIVSPFVGRLDDVGQDGIELISDIRKVYDIYGYTTKILAASIRSPKHVKDVALAGTDIVTIPFKVFEKMYEDPLTSAGLVQFKKDWEDYIHEV
ncbi:MAG: fructose-6-phosphate aldolase [Candidatus Woesearchaeota archaeon]